MSTRIGITLPEDLYEKYKEYLFRNKKTIQEDLKARIEEALQNWNKEQ